MGPSLEQLVSENRFTIAVVFPVVGAFMLVGSTIEGFFPGFLAFNPYLILFGTAVMRLPLIAGILPLLDWNAKTGLIALTLFSYAIEFIGASTGFPYGAFEYGISLGPMINGQVPLGLPIFFLPLVMNSYLLVLLLAPAKARKTVERFLMVLTVLLAMDVVLDPAAVALNFWNYEESFFYGVPLSNFRGWLLSGTISILILDQSFDREKMVERLEGCEFMLDDLVSFTFLWGFVNLYFGNLIPAMLALVFLVVLVRTDRFNTELFSDVL